MKQWKIPRRCLSAVLAAVTVSLPMAICTSAQWNAETPETDWLTEEAENMPQRAAEWPDPVIFADGWEYPGTVKLRGTRTYVSLREFATYMDNAVVSWDSDTECATAVTDTLTVSAWENGSYLVANGRYLWCPDRTYTEDGIMMVPLTAVARAFGFTWVWDDWTIYMERHTGSIEPGEEYYSADDVWWLSKIIHAEAQGEPFNGKIAVGEVVLNRVASDEFPDTIYAVIFDRTHGVQFTPTVNGAIHAEPGLDSIIAAKLVLDGARIGNELLYFLNPVMAVSTWIPENRDYYMTIGCHDFYT